LKPFGFGRTDFRIQPSKGRIVGTIRNSGIENERIAADYPEHDSPRSRQFRDALGVFLQKKIWLELKKIWWNYCPTWGAGAH
jgi:hypothetical protein